MNGALAPLRHRPFRLLFAGRFASFLGSAIAPVALAFAVLDLGATPAVLGLVLAARSIPQVLLTLFGGVLADRFPRHRVILVANLVAAASQGAAATLVLTGRAEIWQLALIEVLNGAAAAFVYPAAAGLTPQTVPADQLQPANALLRLGLNAAMIGGTAFGGVLVATVGPGWGLALDSASFGLGALLLGRIRLPASDRMAGSAVLAELRDGWDEFRSRTWLWVIVVQFGFVNMAVAAAYSTLGPVVADATVGRASWGLVLALQSAGMVAGGLLALRMRPERPLRLATLAVLLEAPFLVLLALRPTTVGLAVAAFLAGVGLETFGVYWDLSLQQHVPQDRLSRVAAYDALGSFVFIPVGQLVAGPLAAAFGVPETLLLAAAMVVLPTLGALAVPAVRGLRRTDAGELVAA